ncbi:6922_t:CDS:1 [Funneliformis geosporum]|uniref:6858_t:CDS:1 n=1 Tax=Funneliformis geosporum TaxID=1117311 RepID=A0A9W4WI67_9GLOM|nr:6922_t:CDS:1 [Funneliformis geosporum]CAI2163560.1 6858_t:CDS:1 [Funneliformis geosporum]
MSSRVFSKFELENLLNNLDYDEVSKLPYDNPDTIAYHARRYARIQTLDGMGLLKWNIENETQKLFLEKNPNLINSAAMRIWETRLKPFQRQEFEKMAKDANEINQIKRQIIEDTQNRIARIDITQVGNLDFEHSFFNGTSFGNNNKYEFLFPAGSSGNSEIYGW